MAHVSAHVVRCDKHLASTCLDPALHVLTDGVDSALAVSNNALSGPLPSGLSALTKLVTLNLGGNGLTGASPSLITALTALS